VIALCVAENTRLEKLATGQRLNSSETLAFLCGFVELSLLNRQLLQQLLPNNRYIGRCIRTDEHLVAFDLQHRDLDLFTGRGFNDEGFAWVAGEDEHGGFRASIYIRYHRVEPRWGEFSLKRPPISQFGRPTTGHKKGRHREHRPLFSFGSPSWTHIELSA